MDRGRCYCKTPCVRHVEVIGAREQIVRSSRDEFERLWAQAEPDRREW